MDDWAGSGWAWCALALVNAGLAEQKHRSRLTWFLLSLFIGPFATAAIVFWAPLAEGETKPFRPLTDREDRIALFVILLLCVALLFALTASIARQPWFLVGSASAIGVSAWLYFRGRHATPQ